MRVFQSIVLLFSFTTSALAGTIAASGTLAARDEGAVWGADSGGEVGGGPLSASSNGPADRTPTGPDSEAGVEHAQAHLVGGALAPAHVARTAGVVVFAGDSHRIRSVELDGLHELVAALPVEVPAGDVQ